MTNPIVLSAVGNQHLSPRRIYAFVWEGATASGDTCEVRDPVTDEIKFFGRTSLTQTYLGIQFGTHGLPAPNGFKCTILAAGRILVYLRED